MIDDISAGSLHEFLAARLGRTEALKTLAFLFMWQIVRESLGRVPKGREYARWWGLHRSAHTRQMMRFREGFGKTSAEVLADRLSELYPDWRSGGVTRLAGLPITGLDLDESGGNPWRTARRSPA